MVIVSAKKSRRRSSVVGSIAFVAIAAFFVSHARFDSAAPGTIVISSSSRSPNRFGPPDPKSPASERRGRNLMTEPSTRR